MKTKIITAEEFDRRFDNGEDIEDYVDWSSGGNFHEFWKEHLKKLETEEVTKEIHIRCSVYTLEKLDQKAKRLGTSRTALINQLIESNLKTEKLEHRS